MSKCKHCNQCKNGCDFCECCGKCQRCDRMKPIDFGPPVPQYIPVPYPVQPYPAQPWIDPWQQPIITWGTTGLSQDYYYDGNVLLAPGRNGGTYE